MPKPPTAAAPSPAPELSRRKRQIMDAVYAKGQADVQDVLTAMADPPSYSSVRTMMNVLAEEGHLVFKKDGRRHVYAPVQPRAKAASTAARRMLSTFFGGSVTQAVAGLLGATGRDLSATELDELARLVRDARKKAK